MKPPITLASAPLWTWVLWRHCRRLEGQGGQPILLPSLLNDAGHRGFAGISGWGWMNHGPVGSPHRPGGPLRSSVSSERSPAKPPDEDRHASSDPHRSTIDRSSTTPAVVLIVEDDADIAATIRSGLQATGYQTLWAEDGAGALLDYVIDVSPQEKLQGLAE